MSGPSSGTPSHVSNTTRVCAQGESYKHSTTTDMLTDDVLLDIFDSYRKNYDDSFWRYNGKWHLLAHVCQRWRQIVFASPHRLNVAIFCTSRTPVRKDLGIWPTFPLVVKHCSPRNIRPPAGEDNVIAALEHPNRVCDVWLDITCSQWRKVAALMQKPFPVLTDLLICSGVRGALVLPAGFLGGSAPRLRTFYLYSIPFPALPTLLLSTSNLVKLRLIDIPPTGYISPQAMIVGLAALSRLESFNIKFQSVTSRPDRIHPPPVTRTILPALTYFQFKGAAEYLEDLVAQIDGPQLNRIYINYPTQLVNCRVAQLAKFIDRSGGPESTPFKRAHVTFSTDWRGVTFDLKDETCDGRRRAMATISGGGLEWQVSHMIYVFGQFSAVLPNVVRLELKGYQARLVNMGDVDWLRLLHQFSTVRALHLNLEIVTHVALALEDITGDSEKVAKVLPSLDLIYLEHSASSIEKFVAARQLSRRPITIARTETEFDQRLNSYARMLEQVPYELGTL